MLAFVGMAEAEGSKRGGDGDPGGMTTPLPASSGGTALPVWRRIAEQNGVTVIAMIGAVAWITGSIGRLDARVEALEKAMDRVKDKVGMVSPGETTRFTPEPPSEPQQLPSSTLAPDLSKPRAPFPSALPETPTPSAIRLAPTPRPSNDIFPEDVPTVHPSLRVHPHVDPPQPPQHSPDEPRRRDDPQHRE